MKLRYFSSTNVHWIQRISPFCSLKIFRHGQMVIGRNCQFESGCDLQVHENGKLIVGRRVYMNRYCMVSVHGFVEIGDNSIFGPGVKIFDNNHKFNYEAGVSSQLSVGRIMIGRNCWIASNVIILKGAEIGDNCVIGAGCIIKEKIPSGSIVRPVIGNIIEKIHS